MHNIERPAKLGNICGRFGIEVPEGQLDNGWRVDDAAITFTKTTSPGGDRLLTHGKDVTIGPYSVLSIKSSIQT